MIQNELGLKDGVEWMDREMDLKVCEDKLETRLFIKSVV